MFEIRRKAEVVEIWFGPHKEHNRGYLWSKTFQNELDAITYEKLLTAAVKNNTESIRRNAYNAGYKDGRNKKQKVTWFSPCFNYLGDE